MITLATAVAALILSLVSVGVAIGRRLPRAVAVALEQEGSFLLLSAASSAPDNSPLMLRATRHSVVSLCADGIRFRTMSEAHLRFANITHVDARFTRLSVHLSFAAVLGHNTLRAHFRDPELARQLLRSLPRHVPLSDRAIALRDAPAHVREFKDPQSDPQSAIPPSFGHSFISVR